jgi:4-amino-4-deoxy-L-arabinose transferase-like glycosyltransferase
MLLAALVYLVGNGAVALWDRDEPRNAMTSRNMLRSGDWVVPRLYDEPRTAKPPLAFWCQAAVMAVLGENSFSARLPSAVAMVVTLGVFGAAVWHVAGPRRAAWAVLVLASSALVLISAKASTMDAVLLLWVTTAQWCGYAVWRGHGRWWVWIVMGAVVGLAGLTKGPVVLGVMGMTWIAVWLLGLTIRPKRPQTPAAAFEVVVARSPEIRPESSAFNALGVADTGVPTGFPKTGRSRSAWVAKCLIALLIVAAVCGPWLYLVQKRSPGWVGTSVSHDVVRRMAQPLEGHKGPPGYHLAAVWPFFLPWSLLLPLAVALAWKRRHLPQLRFALGAVLGPWLMFELVRTKLPHYMLPTYPWLALLVGDAIVRCLRGQHRDLTGTPFLVALAVVATLAGAAALGPAAAAWWFGESIVPGAIVAAAALVYLAVVVGLFFRRRTATGLAALALGAMATWALAWAVYLPRAQFLRVSVRTADVLRREGATGPRQAMMLDYKEPSLAFYQGGTIREHPATQLTREHLGGPASWLVITTHVWEKTAPDVRAAFEVVDQIEGFAYAGGRTVKVMVVKTRGAGRP